MLHSWSYRKGTLVEINAMYRLIVINKVSHQGNLDAANENVVIFA